MKKTLFLSGFCLLVTACDGSDKPVAPRPSVHYVVGSAWKADGRWFYPREEFSYTATGLAVRQGRGKTSSPLTTDGELRSDMTMTGSHQTLQLPAIVTVTNLDNGRVVVLRLNDRGPADAGRILAVTPRVADALGMGGQPVRVRIVENETVSRDLASKLPGGPVIQIAAVPVREVMQKSLDGGEAQHAVGAVSSADNTVGSVKSDTYLADLSAVWQQGPAAPNSGLWIETVDFTSPYLAGREAAKQGAVVVRVMTTQGQMWSVRQGPFLSINDADAALRRSLAAGQTGSHIVVE